MSQRRRAAAAEQRARETGRRRNRHIAMLLAMAGMVAAVVLLWPRDQSRDRASNATEKVASRTIPPRAWAITAPPTVTALEAGREIDRSRVGLWMLEDPALPIVVADALIGGRFPRWSHPLLPGMVDLLEPNARAETCGALQRKDGSYGDPALCVLFTADKARMIGEAPLYATLEVLRGKDRQPVRILDARAKQVEYLTRAPLGPEASLTFDDQGDHLYGTTFTTKDSVFADHFGYINLEVDLEVGGDQFHATLDVWNQPADRVPARFTPPFREAMVNGSLTIYAVVTVATAGSYVFDANLFDAAGSPVAFMHQVLDLPTGRSEVPLQVFGRVIREQGAAGPFSLANLRGFLFLLGKDPDRQLMDDYEGEYTTQAYATTDFSRDEYWDPDKEAIVHDLMAVSASGSKGITKATIGDTGESGWHPSW